MAEFPAMPFWTDAYLGDTTHLTCIEHGAYFLLLTVAWRSKNHCLPDDDKLLARFCRLRADQWRRIRPAIAPLFEINNGFWFHARMLDELDYLRRMKARRSRAGIIGALKRWHRDGYGTRRTDPCTRVVDNQVLGSVHKPLKSHEAAIANGCDDDGKAIAPTPTKIREEAAEKKKSEQINGTPELLAVIQRKAWI